MKKNNVVELTKPETQSDMLTDLLVTGARDMLHKAIEVEVAAFLQNYEDRLTDTGRKAVVRSGYQPVPTGTNAGNRFGSSDDQDSQSTIPR